MECERKLIYFSTYENGIKISRAGYAGIFIRDNVCEVQIYYREAAGEAEEPGTRTRFPVYIFCDGTVMEGAALVVEEGMATANFRTYRTDFMGSGRRLEELDAIYIDGAARGICGGRPDGREITAEVACALAEERKENKVREVKRQNGGKTAASPQKQENLLWLLALLAGK